LYVALLTGTGQAQVPATSSSALPLTPGFMPPYEIARTVRRAGFDPLAPPRREGPIYVVRATDFRGILMRVVVDARSGAIRDASRIVPGPGSYGSIAGMAPYEPLPNETPAPYGPPLGYGPGGPLDDGEMMAPRPPVARPLSRANVTVLPPLPRPRPPEIAARKPDGAKPAAEAKSEMKPETKPQASSETTPQASSETKSEATGSAAVPSAAARPAASSSSSSSSAPQISAPPAPATAAAKPRKSLETPPIND